MESWPLHVLGKPDTTFIPMTYHSTWGTSKGKKSHILFQCFPNKYIRKNSVYTSLKARAKEVTLSHGNSLVSTKMTTSDVDKKSLIDVIACTVKFP